MEVMIPSMPAMAGELFNFESSLQDPAGSYFSGAPTSPTISSSVVFNRQSSFSTMADFEVNTHRELFYHSEDEEGEDFAFEFNGHLDLTYLSADELFAEGRIKPLEQPPEKHEHLDSEFLETTRRDTTLLHGNDDPSRRERVYFSSGSRKLKLSNFSLPLTTFNTVLEPDCNYRKYCSKSSSSVNSSCSSSNSSSWYGKWKLTDLLLFRNASDGHAINKKYDHLRKIKSQNENVIKNSSLISSTNDNTGGSMSRGRRNIGKVSAHEWHYKVYQAAAEDTRRKTFLPYKKTIISCMNMGAGFS